MKLRITILLVLVLAGTAYAFAQQAPAPKPQLFFVQVEQYLPGMEKQYLEANKSMMALMKEARFSRSFQAYAADDMTYYYFMPLASLGDMDTMSQEFFAATKGERGQKSLKDATASTKSSTVYILAENQNLGYVAPGMSPTDEKANAYCHLDIYQIRGDGFDTVMELSKEYRRLSETKKLTGSYRVFTPVVGMPYSQVVALSCAPDAVTLAKFEAKDWELFGDEGQAVVDKISNHVISTNHLEMWRIDSYTAPVSTAMVK